MKKIFILLSFMYTGYTSTSQIVYTDITPNQTLVPDYVSDSYQVDFDGDLNPELMIFSTKVDTIISLQSVTLSGIAISTYGNTQVIAITSTIGGEDILLADTLHNGSLIGPSASYLTSLAPSIFPGIGLGVQSDFLGISAGDYIDKGVLYVGVKFEISTNTHYGWIRVDVAALVASGTIYDFAYQSIADSSIYAGDSESGFVGLSNYNLNDVKIYSSNQKLYVKTGVEKGILTVYNLLGKQVISTYLNKEQIIDMKHLNKGVYLVSFSNGTSTITKKVFIE